MTTRQKLKACMVELKKHFNVKTLTAVSVFFVGVAIGHTGASYVLNLVDQETNSQAEFAQAGLSVGVEDHSSSKESKK